MPPDSWLVHNIKKQNKYTIKNIAYNSNKVVDLVNKISIM